MKSKKRFAAKPPQPLEITYFADASLGHILANRLREAGFTVVPHDDLFEQGTPDTDWLPEVGRRGWPVLSKDTRIRYTPAELEALGRAGVRLFVLIGGNLRSEQMAEAFLKAKDHMAQTLRKEKRAFVARINSQGKVTKVHVVES
jgi:hypothetical protein